MFNFLPKVDMAYLYLIMVSIAAIIPPVALFIEAIFFFGALEAQFLSVAATFVACVSSAVAVVSEAAIIEADNVLARFVKLPEHDNNIVTKIFMRLLAVTSFLVSVPAAITIILWLAQKVLLACQYVVTPLWHRVQDVLCQDNGMFESLARMLLDLTNELEELQAKCHDMDIRYRANCEQCRKVHAKLATVWPYRADQHTLPVWTPGTPMDTPKVIPEGTRPTIRETLFSHDRVDWRLQSLGEKIDAYQECIAKVTARFRLLRDEESLSSQCIQAMRQEIRWMVRPLSEEDLPEVAHNNAAATTAPVHDVIVDDTVTATAVDAPTVTAGEEPIATEAVVESQPPADSQAEEATVESPIAVEGPDLASQRAEAGYEARLQDRRRQTSELPSKEEMKARRSLWKARIRDQRRAERGPLPQEQDDREEPIPACLQQEEVVHQEEVLVQEEASTEPDVSCTQQDNVEDEEEVDEELYRFCEMALLEQEEEQDETPSQGVQALPTELEEGEGSRQIQSYQRHEAEEVSQQATYDYQMAVYNSAEDQTSPTEAGRAQAAPESTPMDLDESQPTTITEFASDGMQLDDSTTSDRRRYVAEVRQDAFDPELMDIDPVLMDIDVRVDSQTALDGAGPVADAPEPMDVEKVDLAPTEEPERESPIEMDLDNQPDPDEARPDAGASEPMDVDKEKKPQLLPFVFNGVNLGSRQPQQTLNHQPAPVAVAARHGTAAPPDVQTVYSLFGPELMAAEESRQREARRQPQPTLNQQPAPVVAARHGAAAPPEVQTVYSLFPELMAAEESRRREAEAQARAREEEAARASQAQARPAGPAFQFQAGVDGEALFDESYSQRYHENGELTEESHRWMYRNRDPNAAVAFEPSYEQRYNEDGTARPEFLAGTWNPGG